MSGSIDTERNRVNALRHDGHAGFQGAELLQTLTFLERAGRQRHEASQGIGPVGIDADVVVARGVTAGYREAREIQRPPGIGTGWKGNDGFNDIRVGRLGFVFDLRDQCRNVDRRRRGGQCST